MKLKYQENIPSVLPLDKSFVSPFCLLCNQAFPIYWLYNLGKVIYLFFFPPLPFLFFPLDSPPLPFYNNYEFLKTAFWKNSELQKNCRNSIRSFHIYFTQFPWMLASLHKCHIILLNHCFYSYFVLFVVLEIVPRALCIKAGGLLLSYILKFYIFL